MVVFSLGIVRGLIYGALGAGLGMGLTVLGRSLAGMPPWRAGPVVTIGILVGLLAYLAGLGALAIALLPGQRRRLMAGNYWGVEAVVKYWHFVDVAWVFIYPTLYLVS